MNRNRLLILCGKSQSSTIVYNALIKQFPLLEVIQEEKPSRKKLLKGRAKRIGWFKVLGQIAFLAFIPRILRLISNKRQKEILKQYGMDDTSIPSLKIKSVDSVNSAQTLELIQKINPELIIVNGTRIISKKILSCVECKFINVHLGITPMYRGVHGGYWALANKDPQNFGATIHFVDKGIDTGAIIKRVLASPSKSDNYLTYPLLQLCATIPSLIEVIHQVLNENVTTIKAPSSHSALWYHPALLQYIYNLLFKSVS